MLQRVEEVTEVHEDVLEFPSRRSQDNTESGEGLLHPSSTSVLGWRQPAAWRLGLSLRCLEGTRGVDTASPHQPCAGLVAPRDKAGVRDIPKREDGEGKAGSCAHSGDQSGAFSGAPAGQVSVGKLLSHHVLLPV